MKTFSELDATDQVIMAGFWYPMFIIYAWFIAFGIGIH